MYVEGTGKTEKEMLKKQNDLVFSFFQREKKTQEQCRRATMPSTKAGP